MKIYSATSTVSGSSVVKALGKFLKRQLDANYIETTSNEITLNVPVMSGDESLYILINITTYSQYIRVNVYTSRYQDTLAFNRYKILDLSDGKKTYFERVLWDIEKVLRKL